MRGLLRLYRLLLKAYPFTFRRRFEAAMYETFEDELTQAFARGRLHRVVFCVRTLWDVVTLAAIERWEQILGPNKDEAAPWRAPRRLEDKGERLMSFVRNDLRFAVRLLLKRPAMTAAAVVALALGTGLTATAFSIVYGTMFRQLPFEDTERLVDLSRVGVASGARPGRASYHDYVAWREQLSSYDGLAASAFAVVNLSGDAGGPPEAVTGALIEPEAFRLLGVSPQLGRLITHEEDRPGGPGVMLISHELWQKRFGSDATVIGREVRVNVRRFSPGWRGVERMTVVGVMPPGFSFPRSHQVWLPLRLDLAGVERGQGGLEAIGKLAPGVGLDRAGEELATVALRLAAEFPESNEGVSAQVAPFVERFTGAVWKRITLTMLAGAILVLLVACANVANLLLARATIRRGELALRLALGASKANVVSLLLAEAVLLAVVGGGLGILLASFGVEWFDRAWNRYSAPSFWWNIRLDATPLTFTLGMILISGLLAGILPALQVPEKGFRKALKDGGRGGSQRRWTRWGRGLAVAEIALATGVLVATGLTVKSVANLSRVDVGSDLHEVFTTRLGLWQADYPDAAGRQRFWDELLRRVEARPNVRHAALASGLPMDSTRVRRITPEGASYPEAWQRPEVNFLMISPRFFQVFGIDLMEGRDFEPWDGQRGEPVVIVNQSFARRFFGPRAAVGRTVRIGDEETPSRVIGVVADLFVDGPGNDRPEGIYVPMGSRGPLYMNVLARTRGDTLALLGALHEDIAALDPHLATFQTGTVADFVFERTWSYRVYSTFYVVFGAVALFLATVGLYSVIAFGVSRRTHEIGVRMVLGADPGEVLRMVLRQAAAQVGVGIVLGTLLALWLTRGLRGILFELDTWDYGVYVSVLVVLAATGLAASLLPAHRASGVEPSSALRHE